MSHLADMSKTFWGFGESRFDFVELKDCENLPSRTWPIRLRHFANLCLLSLSLLSTATGCSSQDESGQVYTPEGAGILDAELEEVQRTSTPPPPPPPPPPTAESAPASTDAAVAKTPRKLLRTADLHVVVGSIAESARIVAKSLEPLGAYIESETNSGYEYTMTIRVPNERLDTLLASISGGAERVEYRQVDVVDVTSEYVDVAARLATQRALATRLQDLLKRANKVSEVLEIEREFSRVTAEIEAYEARIKSIDRQASLATLRLRLRSEIDQSYTQPSLSTQLLEALQAGGQGLRWALIGMVGLWPLWLLIAVAILLWRRRNRQRKSTIDWPGSGQSAPFS